MRTLIVAPLITLRNWGNEFAKFTKIDPCRVVILEGSGLKREKLLAHELFSGKGDKIVIVNYEGLMMKGVFKLLNSWKPEVVVADELHYIKNHKSSRSKLLRHLSENARFKYGLTGTVLLNSPADIFGQWLFLDNGQTFGENYYSFQHRYFLDKNARMPKHIHFPKWVAKADAIEKIKQKIAPMSATGIRDECLDLPPLVRQKIEVKMTPAQEKLYKDMKKDFVAWVRGTDHATVASTALVKALRLMQIASGFVKTDEAEEIALENNPKEKALEELLQTLIPNKVIIWSVFKQNYESIKRVCAKLNLQYVECHGEISNAAKFANVDRFNSDPNCNIFIGHPQSLGIGINLIAARYSVYFSRTFSLGNDVQSEARNYRAGSEIHESVTRYDLVSTGTIDELCLEALKNKAQISAQLVQNWAEDELL